VFSVFIVPGQEVRDEFKILQVCTIQGCTFKVTASTVKCEILCV